MKRDYKQFFAICKKANRDYKEVVAEFTDGRTESLSALTDREYLELLLQVQRFNGCAPATWTPSPGDRQRKKFIAMAKQMGWGNGDTRATVAAIDNWLLKQPKYAAPLNQLTPDELGRALTVFEKVLGTFLRDLN